MSAQETGPLSKVDKNIKYLPIISLTSPAITPPSIAHQLPHFFQFSDHITFHIRCIAAIVGQFKWRKVTVIYESKNGFSAYSGILTLLSDTLKAVNTDIEHHSTFPSLPSLSNAEAFIEQELVNMRSRSNRVFVVVISSLEMAVLLFEKAKQLGMMEKGYVWIVTDEIASFLDSFDSSVVNNMQGVIGFRTGFVRSSKPFKRFRSRFRSKYRSEYPEEDEYCNPSIFALRAYDATWAIAQAMKNSPGKISSKDLSRAISSSRFRGVSGVIRFKNNVLRQMPSFQIINVVGNSYREIAVWSPDFGFLKSLEKHNGVNSSGSFEEWGPVYWPGGEGGVPRGWVISETDKPLKIGVPAMGAFHEFVKVSLDEASNKTCVTGFSINVFEATLKRLPYYLPYVFVPFNGSYDKMVEQVHDKVRFIYFSSIISLI
jgi:ionotropic glutamate receptor NMDA 1/ionotropic glutamate receptor